MIDAPRFFCPTFGRAEYESVNLNREAELAQQLQIQGELALLVVIIQTRRRRRLSVPPARQTFSSIQQVASFVSIVVVLIILFVVVFRLVSARNFRSVSLSLCLSLAGSDLFLAKRN